MLVPGKAPKYAQVADFIQKKFHILTFCNFWPSEHSQIPLNPLEVRKIISVSRSQDFSYAATRDDLILAL